MPPNPTRHNTPESGSAKSWQAQAACLDYDTELFFPEKSDSLQTGKAKSICANCSVTGECLEFAIKTDTVYGIFGGTTEEERAELRRRIARRRINLARQAIRG